MQTYPDFMVDIETLGKGPRAAVVQIGICAFDLRRGLVGVEESWRTHVEPGCEIDADTVAWWMQQSDAARQSVFSGERLSATEALLKMSVYVGRHMMVGATGNPPTFWAMPPSFDIVILDNLNKVCGTRPSWEYNATRCLRTLCDLAGLSKNERIQPLVEHDAGSDARAQAHTAVVAYQRLNHPNRTST